MFGAAQKMIFELLQLNPGEPSGHVSIDEVVLHRDHFFEETGVCKVFLLHPRPLLLRQLPQNIAGHECAAFRAVHCLGIIHHNQSPRKGDNSCRLESVSYDVRLWLTSFGFQLPTYQTCPGVPSITQLPNSSWPPAVPRGLGFVFCFCSAFQTAFCFSALQVLFGIDLASPQLLISPCKLRVSVSPW